jgi:hypothetical protein
MNSAIQDLVFATHYMTMFVMVQGLTLFLNTALPAEVRTENARKRCRSDLYP